MKKLLIFFILSSSLNAWACPEKINPTKVMLFLDTNFSDQEIAVAEKAACKRGERLVVIPTNYKSFTKLILNYEKAKKVEAACPGYTLGSCPDQTQKTKAALQEIEKLKETGGDFGEQVKVEMEKIRQSGGKIQNFIISGHDGGGNYSGNKAEISRYKINLLFSENKEVNEVKSVILLGCYTGVQKEIIEWKNIFPKAQLIAGYDGSAPLSQTVSGHDYFQDILVKEKGLIANAEQKKLARFLKGQIRGLDELTTAIYVTPLCLDPAKEQGLYYGSKKKKVEAFDPNQCKGLEKDFEAMKVIYTDYYYGMKEPPVKSSTGPLRDLYDKARGLEHCIDSQVPDLNVSNIFNLRFYSGVKRNFANFYKTDLKEVQADLKDLNLRSLEKDFKEFEATKQAEILELEKQLEELKKDPTKYREALKVEIDEHKARRDALLRNPALGGFDDYKELNDTIVLKEDELMSPQAQLEKKAQSGIDDEKNTLAFHARHLQMLKDKPEILKNIFVPTTENLSRKSRKETMDNIHNIGNILKVQGLNQKHTKALMWLGQSISEHILHLQNPFSWHEYTGNTEAPAKVIRYNPPSTPSPFELPPLGSGI